MTLPTSGPLSLNDIKGEFGGPTSPSLGDYYAGGSYVPSGTSGTYGAVPSSGTISIQNFYGTTNAIVNFVNESVYANNNAGAATAGYQVNADGFDYQGINGTYTSLTQWVTPSSQGGNYEIYATVSSGSITTGTTGSWVATSGSPIWTVVKAGPAGINSATLSMQVRRAGDTTVLDTWTVTLTAERD